MKEIKHQKKSDYAKLAGVVRNAYRAASLQSSTDEMINDIHGDAISVAVEKAFGLSVPNIIGPSEFGYVTKLPTLGSPVNNLLSIDPMFEKDIKELKDNIFDLSKLDGSVNLKKATLKGEYKSLAATINIDMLQLIKIHNFTALDLMALLLNEIGKIFTFYIHLDDIKRISKDTPGIKLVKKTTTAHITKVINGYFNKAEESLKELTIRMNKLDVISDEFLIRLGYHTEAMRLIAKLDTADLTRTNVKYDGILNSTSQLLVTELILILSPVVHFVLRTLLMSMTSLGLLAVPLWVMWGAFYLYLQLKSVQIIWKILTKDAIKLTTSRLTTTTTSLARIRIIAVRRIKLLVSMGGNNKVRIEEFRKLIRLLDNLEGSLNSSNWQLYSKLFSGNTKQSMMASLKDNRLYIDAVKSEFIDKYDREEEI